MKYIYLLLIAFSFTAFSEAYLSQHGNLLFVLEKLDHVKTKHWANYATETLEQNQNFMERTGLYAAGILTYEKTLESLEDWSNDWKRYYEKCVGDNREKAQKLRNLHTGLFDGLDNFKKSLQKCTYILKQKSMLQPKDVDPDIFVAYLSRDGRIAYPFTVQDTLNIEMAMAVIVPRDETPITIHMGISRNIHNLVLGAQSPQISTQLHGFAAKVVDQIYPHRTMITTPSGPMTKILVAAGLPEEDISVGQGEGARVRIVSDHWKENFQFALLTKDRNGEKFRKNFEDKSFINYFKMLHVNVPFVAVDFRDLSQLFESTISFTGE